MVKQEKMENLAQSVLLDQLERGVYLECQACLDLKVIGATQVLMVPKESWVPLVKRVNQVDQDLMVHRVRLAQLAHEVSEAEKVHQDPQE